MRSQRGQHRQRALLCPFAGTTRGHVVRCFAVGEALSALGFHVGVAGPRSLRREVQSAGFEFVDEAFADQMRDIAPLRPARRAKAVLEMLEGARRALRAFRPAVVVGDLAPAVHVQAAFEGLPSVSLANLELFRFPLRQWIELLEAAYRELDLPWWAASRSFGDAFVVGDISDWVGLRDLGPTGNNIIRSVREIHFVGPILRGKLIPWELRPARRRQRVVISLGGGPSPGAHLFDGCAGIDADYDVIVAGKVSAESRKAALRLEKSIRGRVAFHPFDDAFPRRIAEADVLVAHGGHGTLVQALTVGVPTLAVPLTREQTLNANRLLGLGEFTPEAADAVRSTIGPKLAALLADRKRDDGRKLYAESLRAYGGAAHAARIIRVIAHGRGKPQ